MYDQGKKSLPSQKDLHNDILVNYFKFNVSIYQTLIIVKGIK